MNKILFSHKSDIWETPKEIYDSYMRMGFYDPCPINPKEDGLTIEWKRMNFVNPPYSQIKKWVKKAIEEHKKWKLVVLLLPARTDTKWFRELWDYGCDITFFTGRMKFSGKGTAPFGSALFTLNGHYTECSLTTIPRDPESH